MRLILIFFIGTSVFAQAYKFDEYKFVFAANQEFKKSGNISFDGNKTIITYNEPQYKQIVTDGQNVTVEGSSGKIYKLKGKARFYTNQFIELMTKIDEYKEITTNRDFDVVKDKEKYTLSFNGEIQDQVPHAEVIVKKFKVISFKLFMKNDDTLEIVKR